MLRAYHNEIDRASYWERHLADQDVAQGDLRLCPASNRVLAGSARVSLRPMEFRLLHFLMTHPDEVHTRNHLLAQVWGDWAVVGPRTVDVHVRRLRATLQPFGLDHLVQTVHCRGYLFAADTVPENSYIN